MKVQNSKFEIWHSKSENWKSKVRNSSIQDLKFEIKKPIPKAYNPMFI